MSSNELQDDLLQRYSDNELSELESESVRQRLTSDDEAKLRGLDRLHEMVSVAAEHMGEGLDTEALFSRVSAGIKEEQRLGRGPELQVVPGTSKKKDTSSFWIATAGIIAAAATLILVLSPDAAEPPSAAAPTVVIEEEESASIIVEESAEMLAAVAIEPPAGSEVEDVDFGPSTGTVFAVEGEAGEPIAVVWINDEEQNPW